ncbi:hypothetical protein [Nocardia xishanensis]
MLGQLLFAGSFARSGRVIRYCTSGRGFGQVDPALEVVEDAVRVAGSAFCEEPLRGLQSPLDGVRVEVGGNLMNAIAQCYYPRMLP